MVYSDEQYRTTIKTNDIEQFLIGALDLKPISKLRFSKELSGALIIVTGILADSNGSYAFDSLDGVEEINLIEIDVPVKINQEIMDEILYIADAIANEFSWIIDLRE